MRALFLSRWWPTPPDNGSKIRIYHLLKALAGAGVQCDVLAFAETTPTPEQVMALGALAGGQVRAVPYRPFRPGRAAALLGFLSPQPRSVMDTFSADMYAQTQAWAQAKRYTVVIASEIDMAPYALAVSAPRVLEELELTTLYESYAHAATLPRRARAGLTWWKAAAYVRRLTQKFAAITVVSEAERALLAHTAPDAPPALVVPNGVDVAAHSGHFADPQPDTLVYAGALTYQANLDAMQFFIGEVLPLVQAQRPGVRLWLTGRNPPELLAQLPANPAVHPTGYVPDVRPVVAGAWLSVVPLRVGGGTRLKVLESLALGTPVVATCKGTEGLTLGPNTDVLLADPPQALAGHILAVLNDPVLRARLSTAGRQAAQAYDWPRVAQPLLDSVRHLIS